MMDDPLGLGGSNVEKEKRALKRTFDEYIKTNDASPLRRLDIMGSFNVIPE
jgi:hypothetical protein